MWLGRRWWSWPAAMASAAVSAPCTVVPCSRARRCSCSSCAPSSSRCSRRVRRASSGCSARSGRAVAADQRFVLGGLLGQARRAFVAGEAARTQILRRRQGAGGPGLRGGVGGQGQPLFGEGQHGSAVGDDVRYHDQQVVGTGVGGDRHGTDQWPAVRIDAFRQFALVDFPQPLLLATTAHLAQRDGPLAGHPARVEPGIVLDPRAQRMPRLQRVEAAAQVVDGQLAMDPHPGNHVQRGELVAEPVPAFHRGQRASYLGHHSTPGKVSASSFCRAKVRSGAKRK